MTEETGSALSVFQALLNEPEQSPDDVKGDICPITCAPPGENGIRLPCGHHFSYEALFEETVALKRTAARPYDTDYVPKHHLRCPYCRSIFPGLLPYVPSIYPEKIQGVNAPQRRCRPHASCAHQMIRGSRKGETCGKPGFIWNGRAVCVHHWREAVKKEKDDEAWTSNHAAIHGLYTIAQLKLKLRALNLPVYGTKRTLVLRLCAQTHTPNIGPD